MSKTQKAPEGRARRKYEPGIVKLICEIIAKGNPFITAYTVAGIDGQTFTNWRKEEPEFEQAVQEAKQKAIEVRIGRLNDAAKNSWQADAWWLERMFPELFALKHQVQITDVTLLEHVGEALSDAGLSEEQLLAVSTLLKARLKSGDGR